MEKFIRRFVYTGIAFLKIFRRSQWNAGIKKIQKKNGSCYILANGPSLNKDMEYESSDFFAKQSLFVVNNFVESELYAQLKPKYYVIADPCYFVESEIKLYWELSQNFFNNILQKTSWEMQLFVPAVGFDYISQRLKQNTNIKVISYNNVPANDTFKWFDHFVHNRQLAIFSGINIAAVTIYLAIYLGFEEINLLGVDHSWHRNLVVGDDNLIYLEDPHFYDAGKPQAKPIMYIDKNNSKSKARPITMHEQFAAIAKTFETYRYIQDYAVYKGVKIYNCCRNSFIDVFERKY